MTGKRRFDGQAALVTGAGAGIGYALCRALAAEGALVALNDLDPALAGKAAETINNEIGAERVHAYPANVADVTAMRVLTTAAAARFGRLDVCIANAGITLFGQFLDYEPERFDQLVAVNLRGTYFTAQAAARIMVEKRIAGRIILMASVTGIRAVGGLGTYGISKAGIMAMARSLAFELGEYGITVNAIAPGATLTERTLQETPNYATDWARVNPLRKVAHVEDIAGAALFLASADAGHLSGQTLVVDGAWSVASPMPDDY